MTFLPVLVVANDRDYLGDKVNGPLANPLGVIFLAIIVVTTDVDRIPSPLGHIRNRSWSRTTVEASRSREAPDQKCGPSIVSLEVGPAGLGHPLGYDRGETAGPWPLTAIFRRLACRSINVPWSAVDEVSRTTVTLTGRHADPVELSRRDRAEDRSGRSEED